MITTRAIDLSPEGLQRSAAMLRAAMPRAAHMSAEFLAWQYVANPSGAALGLEAFDGERVVSHCVVQPLVARLHGREVRGVMSLNAATLPEYLGRGIYFGLADELYANARGAGYGFGVAVTNDNSTRGFVRRCGFTLMRPLHARIGVGSIPEPRREAGVDFEKLWNEAALTWRLSPPHVRYRYETRGQTARVLAPSGHRGIEVVLGDVSGRNVPGAVAATRHGFSPLRLWLGLDERIDWRRSLYFDLPLRVRPSPLNLIFADL
ncbi:MAG: GNAT family N-acetyltransferase, partial [Deltaproteobacteria bacterium]|nr:GNAT family N-acetyltransferase [Deltaproteobacteria bacterium]